MKMQRLVKILPDNLRVKPIFLMIKRNKNYWTPQKCGISMQKALTPNTKNG